MVKLRIKYGVTKWIMGKYRGKVRYPFVLFKQAQKDVTDTLFRHEMQHVYQIRRMGWWTFYGKYIYLLIRHGYQRHPFELEAWERQKDPLTKEERKLKENP